MVGAGGGGAGVRTQSGFTQGKAPCKRKLERSSVAIPVNSSVCLNRTELLKLDSTLESPREVLTPPPPSPIYLGAESSISVFPGPPVTVTHSQDCRPQRGRPDGHRSDTCGKRVLPWGDTYQWGASQACLAIRTPMGPFIKIQTPRPNPKPTKSESQEMRYHQNVLCIKKQKKL